jgi:ankyrin repeat protein
LVEAGADIHAEDKDGDTPLDIANRYGTRFIARYLMSKGAGY